MGRFHFYLTRVGAILIKLFYPVHIILLSFCRNTIVGESWKSKLRKFFVYQPNGTLTRIKVTIYHVVTFFFKKSAIILHMWSPLWSLFDRFEVVLWCHIFVIVVFSLLHGNLSVIFLLIGFYLLICSFIGCGKQLNSLFQNLNCFPKICLKYIDI